MKRTGRQKKWWNYVKACIREYPRMERILDSSSGIQEQREYRAVSAAVRETEARENGQARLAIIQMMYFRNTHTLQGAADIVHVSSRTARRWNWDFIMLTAKHMGLTD